MKNVNTILCCLFLLLSCNKLFAQETSKNKQIGLTGLPIIYFYNGTPSIEGGALYGNYGWFLKDKTVLGIRPFAGIVDFGRQGAQKITSVGTNIYYRTYFNRSKTSFFIDVNTGLGYINYSTNIENVSYQENLKELNGMMFNFAFGPGVDIEIKNGLKFEFLVQYLEMHNISSPNETSTGNTVIPSIGIQKFI